MRQLQDINIRNASVVVLNFTLQFIPREERDAVLARIYRGLQPGGIMVLSEKVTFEDPHLNELNIELHHQFKRANGYSELEVARKRQAIENVLLPETLARHRQRISEAGFQQLRCLVPVFQLRLPHRPQVIDYRPLIERWRGGDLDAWARLLPDQIDRGCRRKLWRPAPMARGAAGAARSARGPHPARRLPRRRRQRQGAGPGGDRAAAQRTAGTAPLAQGPVRIIRRTYRHRVALGLEVGPPGHCPR